MHEKNVKSPQSQVPKLLRPWASLHLAKRVHNLAGNIKKVSLLAPRVLGRAKISVISGYSAVARAWLYIWEAAKHNIYYWSAWMVLDGVRTRAFPFPKSTGPEFASKTSRFWFQSVLHCTCKWLQDGFRMNTWTSHQDCVDDGNWSQMWWKTPVAVAHRHKTAATVAFGKLPMAYATDPGRPPQIWDHGSCTCSQESMTTYRMYESH